MKQPSGASPRPSPWLLLLGVVALIVGLAAGLFMSLVGSPN